MKVYVLFDSDRVIVAIYDQKDLANKMKEVIARKIEDDVTLEVHNINPDIKLVGLNR